MTIGELDRRASFSRRATIAPSNAGENRGNFLPLFRIWAGFSPMSATRRAEYGYAEDIISGWLKVRESRQVGTLTTADRVSLGDGEEFSIDSVPLNDRSGYRLLRISRKLG